MKGGSKYVSVSIGEWLMVQDCVAVYRLTKLHLVASFVAGVPTPPGGDLLPPAITWGEILEETGRQKCERHAWWHMVVQPW